MNKKLFFQSILFSAVTMLLFWQCAIQKAPSGGPADRTPPTLVRTFPTPDSVNVKMLTKAEIEFDENIDRASIRDQIWMLPELPNGFETEWKGGRTLHLVFQDTLAENQTYLITLGTGIKDLRGNKLTSPVILPFSTGPVIDKGEISGHIFAEKKGDIEDAFIYAYAIDDSFSAKTIFEKKPGYYTQVDKDGAFKIQYLRPGEYRLYALQDNNGDRLYTFGLDQIGITFTDIFLDSTKNHFENLNIALFQEDTSGARVSRAKAIHHQLVQINFDEPLKAGQYFRVEIEDSTTHQPLQILATEQNPSDASQLFVYTERQAKIGYAGTVKRALDIYDNPTEKSDFKFRGSEKDDTTRFLLQNSHPKNEQKNVRYDATLQLNFSLPVDTALFTTGVNIFESDSIPLAGRWQFFTPSRPVFKPDTLLKQGIQYHVSLDSARMKDIFGNVLKDSLYSYTFSAWDWDDLGEVGGMITTTDSAWQQILLEASAEGGEDMYEKVVSANQPYEVAGLPDAIYRLKATVDVNKNEKADYGRSNPFQFAEPFQFYSDTVKVRKRWTTDGIHFNFKSPK